MDSESQFAPEATGQRSEKESARLGSAARFWQLLLILIVAPLLLVTVYSKVVYSGLISTDALDFAQVGRNISAGHGMTTYVLRPLALTHGADVLRQPDVTHGPLFPFLLALAFGAVGARDAVASYVSCLFYLLTVPLLFALGQRVFNRTVGLIAAAAFACSGLTLQYAVSGLHISLYTFLVTALFLALYNLGAGRAGQAESADAPLSTKLLVLVGVLTGLLYLTDPLFIWIVPVILGSVLWLCGPKRRGAAFKFLAPCVLVMAPWMARNWSVTGNPIFGLRGTELWMFTDHYFPGRMGYSLYPDDFYRGSYMWPGVVKKVLANLNGVVHTMPQISDGWILAFLMPCLLYGYSSRAATMLRQTTVFTAIALLVGMVLFHIEMTLFTCLVPTMLIFAIAYLRHLTWQAKITPLATWTIAALLGITVIYPAVSQIFLEEKMVGLTEASAAKALGSKLAPQEAVLTDHAEAVAWYADRPAIQIPATDTRITDVRAQFPDTHWVLLTPLARTQSPQWQNLYDQCTYWNNDYVQALMRNGAPPTRMPFTRSPGVSLYKALAGFTWVAPSPNTASSTVIGTFADTKLSMGAEPGRHPAP